MAAALGLPDLPSGQKRDNRVDVQSVTEVEGKVPAAGKDGEVNPKAGEDDGNVLYVEVVFTVYTGMSFGCLSSSVSLSACLN